MMEKLFEGFWTALVTPFRNGKIDKNALNRLIDYHEKAKTDGLVICGTTGESATLSFDEKVELMKFVAGRVGGKLPLVFGTGGNDTGRAVELTKRAEDSGAQGVLVVTPYYNKPTQNGLIAHFSAVAQATNLPVILYNVPGRTGVNLQSATTLELAKISNVKAVKEASGNFEQMMDIIKNAPPGFLLLSGDDSLNHAILAIGGKGVISVTGNVHPALMKAFSDAALAGKWDDAKKFHYQLLDLHRAMFLEANPIPVKTALAMMGIIEEEFRLPLVKCGDTTKEKLKEILKRMDLVK